jgi:hypothetical protein
MTWTFASGNSRNSSVTRDAPVHAEQQRRVQACGARRAPFDPPGAPGRSQLQQRVSVEHRLVHIAARHGRRARDIGVRKNVQPTPSVRRAAAIQNLETIHRRKVAPGRGFKLLSALGLGRTDRQRTPMLRTLPSSILTRARPLDARSCSAASANILRANDTSRRTSRARAVRQIRQLDAVFTVVEHRARRPSIGGDRCMRCVGTGAGEYP